MYECLHWYETGALAWEGDFGSPVAQADCTDAGSRITLGRTEPGFTYGNAVEIYDMRLYVHSKNAPLQTADIYSIASAPIPAAAAAFFRDASCLDISSTLMEDKEWMDMYGNTCSWYSKHRDSYSQVCKGAEARTQCPQACKSKQQCWSTAATPPTYFVWDRIRRIEAKHANGTICLSTKSSASDIVSRCRAWSATRTSATDAATMANWLESSDVASMKGRRIDVTDCDQLEKVIDPECSFDPAPVEQFSADMQKNGGDFTIAFWVRPLGAASMNENPAALKDKNGDARFFPHVSFLSRLSPPAHNLQWGLWKNPNGEVRVDSACGRTPRDLFENIEVRASSSDDWTFLAVSRKNTSTPGNPPKTWTATNEQKNWEATELAHCLFDPKAFFTSLEINFPMLISPIMMIPQAIDFAKAQQVFLASPSACTLNPKLYTLTPPDP